MINIRYHIVSITAIFLALGIGTLLGSTFLDRATVDQLDRNIRNAEARIAATEARNSQLDQEVTDARARDDALIAASETLLDGQLTDLPVLLVVAPGVDQGVVDTLRQILAGADADLRGSLTLRDDLTFADGVHGGLAERLGLDEDDPDGAREEVTTALLDALVAAGAPLEEPTENEGEGPDAGTTTTAPGDGATTTTSPGDTTTTTAPGQTTTTVEPGGTTTTEASTTTEPDPGEDPSGPDGEQPEVLTALIEADLVRFDPGPDDTPDSPVLEQTGYRYVFVSHPDLEPSADALLLDLLPDAETDPPLPAVVVSATVPEPAEEGEEPAPTAVDLVRDDPARSALYDTVDDVDTYLGLTSTVTILRADDGAAAGHYGQGDGATALAPAGQ